MYINDKIKSESWIKFILRLLLLRHLQRQRRIVIVLVLLDRNKSNPVSDLVLFQVFLGQIFQVFTRKATVTTNDNNNFVVRFSSDGNVVT